MSQKKPVEKKPAAKKKTKPGPSAAPASGSPPAARSVESLWAEFGGRSRRSPVDEAQEIMYDAWEAPTRKRAVTLARKALAVSADCADAYNLLAEETAKTIEEAIELYRQGVAAGERALGKEPFKRDAGHFWGLLETRPYMRARAGLAENLWLAGQREEAVEHYRELLRLNPNDNQGLRYLLLPRLIELNRDAEAEKLFKKYRGDGMAVWMYLGALLDFRGQGDSPAAGRSLKKALALNRHVPAYLLGRKKMPRALPEYYGIGDDAEAVVCSSESRAAWKATPGALEWLDAKVK